VAVTFTAAVALKKLVEELCCYWKLLAFNEKTGRRLWRAAAAYIWLWGESWGKTR
jgi:hypothetical protein